MAKIHCFLMNHFLEPVKIKMSPLEALRVTSRKITVMATFISRPNRFKSPQFCHKQAKLKIAGALFVAINSFRLVICNIYARTLNYLRF